VEAFSKAMKLSRGGEVDLKIKASYQTNFQRPPTDKHSYLIITEASIPHSVRTAVATSEAPSLNNDPAIPFEDELELNRQSRSS